LPQEPFIIGGSQDEHDQPVPNEPYTEDVRKLHVSAIVCIMIQGEDAKQTKRKIIKRKKLASKVSDEPEEPMQKEVPLQEETVDKNQDIPTSNVISILRFI